MAKSFTERWQAALWREAAKILPEREQSCFVEAVIAGAAHLPVVVTFEELELPEKVDQIDFPWASEGIFAVSDGKRVAGLPDHEEGAFYMVDAASVFMAQSFRSLKGEVDFCFDICAAPGGKTSLACHYLNPSRLIANEVSWKRCARLKSNVRRCQLDQVECVSFDPDVLCKEYDEPADLVIVDAPCSGQALFARGETSSGAFSKHAIKLNMKRQRRILAAASTMVKPGGYLCYMTCTYSIPENEKNVSWFLKNFLDFHLQVVPELEGFETQLAEYPAYRLWPQQGYGTGGFTVRFKKAVG